MSVSVSVRKHTDTTDRPTRDFKEIRRLCETGLSVCDSREGGDEGLARSDPVGSAVKNGV